MQFVHLRAHSEFSISDSVLRVDDYVAAAKKDAQPALALTDLSGMFAVVRFYKAAVSKGIKPILGADVWIESTQKKDAVHRLLLLVQNQTGYLNLCELISRAFLRNRQKGSAIIKLEWLAEEGLGEGLIALGGAQEGEIGAALLVHEAEAAEAAARYFAQIFPQRFYLEVQRAGFAFSERLLGETVRLASQVQLPIVATQPVQFLKRDDYDAHDTRVCIAEGETVANPRRVKRFSREQYFKSQTEMVKLFADLPSAVKNSLVLAARCSLQLTLDTARLPDFPTPDGTPIADYFGRLSREGLAQRLSQLYPDAAKREAARERYEKRLEFEIQTVLRMGFSGYFLIVADFINWAKTNGCPVGPGRGSGAGSLVAYSLQITDLDPLAYNLLFERFLNPDRVSMPDFDIDFCEANRGRVINYVRNKYGAECVSQIATFGTMAARAAIKDVGRALGAGFNFCNELSGLVPNKPGQTYSLGLPHEMRDPPEPVPENDKVQWAMRLEPLLRKRFESEEETRSLLQRAHELEGISKSIGMHAGGVLIAPGKLTDFTPLFVQPGAQMPVSQFDKDDVEAAGLVKFDFLGLSTLTILELCKDFIRARHKERADFELAHIPLKDERMFNAIFCEAKTIAVFQFESRGMQKMLREAKPDSFEDLIALVSLFRPGPMDLIPSFCARKHGKEPITYIDPKVKELTEEILEETYGIMVYQEQVMQMAQRVGGYTLGKADLLRRAMGKKKADEMAEHRGIFAAGAAERGICEASANEVFDLMEKFAGYGFNKSHAAAYALLSLQTAWCKLYFPAEFFAANMSVSIESSEKLWALHEDARELGLSFAPPDVNACTYGFEPVARGRVRFGLGGVKGTGAAAIEALVQERQNGGAYKSVFDLTRRLGPQHINKRVLESLARAGAFDSLHACRASVLASVETAMRYAQAAAANAGQGGLFDLDDQSGVSDEPPLVVVEPFGIRQQLAEEKSALGFYFSGHLIDEHRDEVKRMTGLTIDALVDRFEPVLIGGILSELRYIAGKKGRMAIFSISDRSGSLEATLRGETLEKFADRLVEDTLVIVRAKVRQDPFNQALRMSIEEMWTLDEARARLGRSLSIRVNGKTDVAAFVDALKLSRDEAGLRVKLAVQRGNLEWQMQFDEAGRVRSDQAVLDTLKGFAIDGLVRVEFE